MPRVFLARWCLSLTEPKARLSIMTTVYPNKIGTLVHPPKRHRRLLTAMLCLATLLAGCSGDLALERFDNYQTRLGRALQQDLFEPSPETPARIPRKRDLMLQQSGSRINILDFLRLFDCSLGEVIGERNSVLGKVAPASQRLFLDLAFLQEAPACIMQLRAKKSDSLAEKLTEAVAEKRRHLPKAIINATLAGDEFAAFWSVPASLGDYPQGSQTALISELQYVGNEVRRWLDGDYQHDPARFENALGVIRHGQGGYLLSSATLTHSHLTAASRMAEARHVRRPLCFDGKTNLHGNILSNVVRKFFVGDVQVWLATVNAARYDLLTPIRALEALLNEANSATYRDWQKRRDAQLDWLSSVPREHVKAVRPLLASCGLAPGA